MAVKDSETGRAVKKLYSEEKDKMVFPDQRMWHREEGGGPIRSRTLYDWLRELV